MIDADAHARDAGVDMEIRLAAHLEPAFLGGGELVHPGDREDRGGDEPRSGGQPRDCVNDTVQGDVAKKGE
jgi:hypothetical protein